MTSSPGIKTYFPAKQETSLLVEKAKPAPALPPATKETGGKIVFTIPKGGDDNLNKFLQNLSAKNSAVEKQKAPEIKEKAPEMKAGTSGTMTSLLNEDNSLTRYCYCPDSYCVL